jgi:putative sigma-54 modulation protein
MQAEFTGRRQKITKGLRTMAEEGLSRIEKVVGRSASAHVTFSQEKYGHAVEVAVKTKLQMIVGLAEAADSGTALRVALEKVEKQALRSKERKIDAHRQGKEETAAKAASGKADTKAKPAVKAALDAQDMAAELHVIPSKESVAKNAMSIHEAVKEAEYKDRDVFVFRDHAGDVKVLHRTKNGTVQLIEVP